MIFSPHYQGIEVKDLNLGHLSPGTIYLTLKLDMDYAIALSCWETE